MTPDPKRVGPDDSARDAARIMREQDCGIVPVVDADDRVVGVVTDRDLVMRVVSEGLDSEKSRVSDVMTTQVHTARPEAAVGDVFDIMGRHQVRRVPVVDDAGRLKGIVALADVARHCATPQTLGKTVEQISLEPGDL
jgi:CBS domain-containing protein